MSTDKNIRLMVMNQYAGEEQLLFVDDHDNAIVGILYGEENDDKLVYDGDKIIGNLMADGMKLDEAEEFFVVKIKGSYMGPKTPIYIQTVKLKIEDEDNDTELQQ